MMSGALEHDLLTLGDRTSIGIDCDLTCHTVENMVLKYAPVLFGEQTQLHHGACVMPGASMERGSSLGDMTLVLKGETVGCMTTWAGLPAAATDLPTQALQSMSGVVKKGYTNLEHEFMKGQMYSPPRHIRLRRKSSDVSKVHQQQQAQQGHAQGQVGGKGGVGEEDFMSAASKPLLAVV